MNKDLFLFPRSPGLLLQGLAVVLLILGLMSNLCIRLGNLSIPNPLQYNVRWVLLLLKLVKRTKITLAKLPHPHEEEKNAILVAAEWVFLEKWLWYFLNTSLLTFFLVEWPLYLYPYSFFIVCFGEWRTFKWCLLHREMYEKFRVFLSWAFLITWVFLYCPAQGWA